MTPADQIVSSQTPMVNPDGARDIKHQQDRVNTLEQLYHLDGRDNINHPLHNTYTGLWLKYAPCPEHEITTNDDGTLTISMHGLRKTVSSHHLVEPAVKQLWDTIKTQ